MTSPMPGTTEREIANILEAAAAAQRSRDWRTCADLYRTAFDLLGPESGYEALGNFTTILRALRITPPGTGDIAFMRRILRTDANSPLHRALCGFTIGSLYSLEGHLQAAASRFRRSIAIAESASGADRDAVAMSGPPQVRVSALLDELLRILREDLASIEGRLSKWTPLERRCASIGAQASTRIVPRTKGRGRISLVEEDQSVV
ncbi:hypothetical protein BDK51DRAFT_41880 [Blyttiomyces helicus]|uniref:Tetratricopeptide repeat protein n=1 Tax=Blyttiomyces helicus TaxID=388810 RepID=A0A4P9VXP6_9FUNG|nr:hypothetical protein BDK51DRAFT_41880 [Blyttiomyces helicus]|eukprot:RKO83705.1 hypothetical protein BDK51DRAFT_41880 [Blyttiomyces helicus]